MVIININTLPDYKLQLVHPISLKFEYPCLYWDCIPLQVNVISLHEAVLVSKIKIVKLYWKLYELAEDNSLTPKEQLIWEKLNFFIEKE